MKARGRLLLPALVALASCGGAASLLPGSFPRVDYAVSPDRRTAWCSGRGDMSITVFDTGYFCWWPCAAYEGRVEQAMLDVDVGSDGLFVDADQMKLYEGSCVGTVECPTCDYAR